MGTLTLETGWWTDTLMLAKGRPLLSARIETRILVAEANYRLGAVEQAETLLSSPLPDTGLQGCLATHCNTIATNATLALSAVLAAQGKSDKALQVLTQAIEGSDARPHDQRAFLLGLAGVQLNQGDLKALVATVQRIEQGAQTAKPHHQAQHARLKGWLQLIQGKWNEAYTHYRQAAQAYAQAHQWTTATSMWGQCAEIAGQTDPTKAPEALSAAYKTAIASMDTEAVANAVLSSYLNFAESHVNDAKPPTNAQLRLTLAVKEATRAERFDLAAKAYRYALLLVPATADVSVPSALVKTGLETSFASANPLETIFLLSLMSQLEVRRMRYTEAERWLKAAIVFAETLGEQKLEQSLREELKALEE